MRTPTSKLKYYSIDVGAFENDGKLKRLRIKYGHDGMTVMRDIWEFVYAEGYYLKATANELAEMIVDYERLPYSKVSRFRTVICYLADNGLIDKTLLDKGVITSNGIQKRYSETMKVAKRKYEIGENWLLADVLSAPIHSETKPLNGETKPFPSEVMTLNSEVMTQSKVKENKVNIKEEELRTRIKEEKEINKEKDFSSLDLAKERVRKQAEAIALQIEKSKKKVIKDDLHC